MGSRNEYVTVFAEIQRKELLKMKISEVDTPIDLISDDCVPCEFIRTRFNGENVDPSEKPVSEKCRQRVAKDLEFHGEILRLA